MSGSSVKRRLRLLAPLFIVLSLTCQAFAQDLSGAWISPDWFFPGGRKYSQQEVRAAAREVFSRLSADNVDTVFLETFLRGYGICPTITQSSDNGAPRVVPYEPESDNGSFPVYPHLTWNYKVEFETVLDPLQIFIEEAQVAGIEVHAWVHMFYWRMDNSDVMYSWHNGPTIWGPLMEEYLRKQSSRLRLLTGRSVRPGYEQAEALKMGGARITPETLEQAANLFRHGCDTNRLSQLLRDDGLKPANHPFGTMITEILKAGGERPDFLLVAGDDDPFPAPRGKVLRPIYVNPANPKVRQRLKEVIANIAEHHPGLAGIHLDHVRYPVDGQGLPAETGIFDGSYRVFSASDPSLMAQYAALTQALAKRREALDTLVADIRAQLPRRLKLSAAVLPLYYRDRDNGKFRTSGYDYSAQAWIDWPVDFVVPMMYEYHPYLIRSLVKDYQALAVSSNPRHPIAVYPGISRQIYSKNGAVGSQGWVFFDLSLSRDVKVENRETEDLDFGGE